MAVQNNFKVWCSSDDKVQYRISFGCGQASLRYVSSYEAIQSIHIS
jgi:hypothetical protein